MDYMHATLILHETGQEINETNLKAVLEAAGAEVVESRVKALVAALEGVDIEAIAPNPELPATDDPAEAAETADEADDEGLGSGASERGILGIATDAFARRRRESEGDHEERDAEGDDARPDGELTPEGEAETGRPPSDAWSESESEDAGNVDGFDSRREAAEQHEERSEGPHVGDDRGSGSTDEGPENGGTDARTEGGDGPNDDHGWEWPGGVEDEEESPSGGTDAGEAESDDEDGRVETEGREDDTGNGAG